MLDYKLGFQGTYVAAVEIGDKSPTLTIREVVIERVKSMKAGEEDDESKAKDRLIVYFREAKRGWLVNRTNAECLVGMWGRDAHKWVGHRVTLFTQMVKVGPKMELGIRVKGSPELEQPKQVEVKLPRKKATMMTLLPTGKDAGKYAGDGRSQESQHGPEDEGYPQGDPTPEEQAEILAEEAREAAQEAR